MSGIADDQRIGPAIFAAERDKVEVGLGYDAGDRGALDLRPRQAVERQQMIEPDDIFVGGALAFGGGAPAALQLGAVPDRE